MGLWFQTAPVRKLPAPSGPLRCVAVHSARHRAVRCRAKAEVILERVHRSFVAHGGRDVETEPLMSSVSASFERSAVSGGTCRMRLAQWPACVPSSPFVRCKRAQQGSLLVTQFFPRALGAGGTSVSVTVQLFSEPSGTIHLDVVRPHRPCGRRALGKRDSRCAQVRTAGDTHLYHEVFRKVREDLKDLNGYDLQLIARDETARVDMRAMLEARRHPPDPPDPQPAREGFAMLGLERQHKIQPPPLGKVHVRRLGWQGLTYVRFSARARHARDQLPGSG